MCLRLLTLIIAMYLGGCCVEGYIVPITRDISLAEAPRKVQKAIIAGYDPNEVESVERTLFRSRCAESWERYRIHLTGGQAITLDEDGKLAKWRDGHRRPDPADGGT